MSKNESNVAADPEAIVGPEPVKAPSEEVVKIKKDTLERLMDRLDRLESAADKKQLARFDSIHKGEMSKKASISLWPMDVRDEAGKLVEEVEKAVLAWRLVKDIVEKNPTTGYWYEDQVLELTLDDDTVEQVKYQEWARRHKKKTGDVISENKTDHGEFWTVKLEDGKEYTLEVSFIN